MAKNEFEVTRARSGALRGWRALRSNGAGRPATYLTEHAGKILASEDVDMATIFESEEEALAAVERFSNRRGPGRPPLDPDQEGELPPRSVRLGPAEHEKVERVQAEMQARRITGKVSYSEAVRQLIRTSPL